MTDTTAGTALSAPLYGATFGQAIARFFTKYATFSGRASRSEFWWFFLFNVIVGSVLYGIGAAIAGASGGMYSSETGTLVPGPGFWVGLIPYWIWLLATIVPWFALIWRRFHDTNRSGAFYFLTLIPFVGGIIVLVMLALPSDPAGARFDA